jgi:hypothetical protein
MGLTKMIEHVLVGIQGSMDATAHNAKHDKRKKYEAGVVWTSLGPLPRWVPGPTTRWAPGTTRLALHGT